MLIVTPEMFGAKGDGVTDDQPAFQRAVDFLALVAEPPRPRPHPALTLLRLTPANLRALARGPVEVPHALSWRKADGLERHGLATIRRFHGRWRGLLELTEAGRAAVLAGRGERSPARR